MTYAVEVGEGIAHRRSRANDRRSGAGRTERLDAEVDRMAEATIPRGRDASDASGAPAVNATIWRTHVRYARTRDPAVLEELVMHYRTYALSLSRRMHRGHEPLEDLEQVALEALVVAIQRFDPQRGLPFPSYATPSILGSLRHHYRDVGWALRVPRRVHELTVAARTVRERLTHAAGRAPTYDEIAAELDITVEALIEVEEAAYARKTTSIEASTGGDDMPLGDRLGGEDDRIASAVDRMTLAEAATHLVERDRELLSLYYVDERSQADIAAHLGVSQMQVSRMLESARRRLRSRMTVTSA